MAKLAVLSGKEVCKILSRHGFEEVRRRGSHVVMRAALPRRHDYLSGKHLEGNPDTRYKRAIAGYFEKVGTKVPWQKLGKDFKDEQFRFQVLDEGDSKAKEWQDTLRQVLATYRV